MLDELADHAHCTAVALVGHEPKLGALAARLIGGAPALAFKKGGVCRIDLNVVPSAGRGRLRWFATPKMLRAVGKGKTGRASATSKVPQAREMAR